MEVEKITNIYRQCGFKINNIDNTFFLDNGWINYSFPQLIDFKPSKKIVNALKWKYLITVIKTDVPQKNSYEYVLKTDDYSIEKFSSKKRGDIRKSLRDCTFKRPSLYDLYHYGLIMNQKTLARQKRNDKYLIDEKFWKRYISTFYDQKNIIILGAYIKERMVGYITVCNINGSYYITDPFYDYDNAASAPTHGLLFTVVNQIIEQEGSITIHYGMESFKPLPQLNRYKSAMRFERIPVTRGYIIHPLLLPFLKISFFFYRKLIKKRKSMNPFMQQIVQLLRGEKILKKTLNGE